MGSIEGIFINFMKKPPAVDSDGKPINCNKC